LRGADLARDRLPNGIVLQETAVNGEYLIKREGACVDGFGNGKLHGVDVGEDIRGGWRDLFSGFRLCLGARQGSRTHLQAFDLRRGDRFGTEEEAGERDERGLRLAIEIMNSGLGLGQEPGKLGGYCGPEVPERLRSEDPIPARPPVAGRDGGIPATGPDPE